MEATFDFYQFDETLTPDQRQVRDRVRVYVDQCIKPAIAGYWERAEFPRELANGLRGLGIMGGVLQGHGCAGLDALSAGLVAAELARGDASVARHLADVEGVYTYEGTNEINMLVAGREITGIGAIV